MLTDLIKMLVFAYTHREGSWKGNGYNLIIKGIPIIKIFAIPHILMNSEKYLPPIIEYGYGE